MTRCLVCFRIPSSQTFSPITMEVLPITSTYLVHLPQVSPHNELVKTLACDNTSYRFITPFRCSRKDKVIFVLGSTGTGKSKLAIDLATHFGGEVVNSDKIQVYDGLNIITNKVTVEECAGIPHHLIGGVHPDADFSSSDFRSEATRAVESILARGHLPIIAGGSNSYIEELIDGEGGKFRSKYKCCFVWIDVDLPILHSFVSTRVDKMVEMGLVEEARGMFNPENYMKGLRKAIGVPEMDQYFRRESEVDEETKMRLLEEAIDEIKTNTCKLTCCQLRKIHRLTTLPGWNVYRVDATEAFGRKGEEVKKVWNQVVREPSIKIVEKFLNGKLATTAAAAAATVRCSC